MNALYEHPLITSTYTFQSTSVLKYICIYTRGGVERRMKCLMVPSAVLVFTLHVIICNTWTWKCMPRERHTNLSPQTAFIQSQPKQQFENQIKMLVSMNTAVQRTSAQMLPSKNNILLNWLQALCRTYASVKMHLLTLLTGIGAVSLYFVLWSFEDAEKIWLSDDWLLLIWIL